MAYKTTLTIGSDHWDVLSISFGFNRSVDIKGKPASIVHNSEISCTVENADDDKLLAKMLNPTPKAEKMEFKFDNGTAEGEMKTLTLTDAYVTGYNESVQSDGGDSGVISLTLTGRVIGMKDATHTNDWPGGHAKT